MEKAAAPDTIVVEGDQLRQAREARGMSVNDMANAVTLSREQIRALEDGGNLPFYTASHKRLALKKYATALGIPWSSLVVDHAEEQASMAEPALPEFLPAGTASGTPATLRMAAAERNALTRRKLMMAAVAATILLAVYAKQRGTTEAVSPSASPESFETGAAAEQPATAAPAGEAAIAALPDPAPPVPVPAPADSTPLLQTAVAAGGPACSLPPAKEVSTWSPAYQRKPDARVFFVSGKATEVCIADASGTPTLISLKPNTGHAFAGKPPYLVSADGLASIEIYMQGMRARVPADAQSLRLVPSAVTRPAEVADAHTE